MITFTYKYIPPIIKIQLFLHCEGCQSRFYVSLIATELPRQPFLRTNHVLSRRKWTLNCVTFVQSDIVKSVVQLDKIVKCNNCSTFSHAHTKECVYLQQGWDDTVSSRYDTYSIRTLPIRYVFDTIHMYITKGTHISK